MTATALVKLLEDGLKQDKPSLATDPTRRQRVTLLLGSYLAAAGPDFDESVRNAPESKALSHSRLWYQGSYADLDAGLEELKVKAPRIHWHTWQMYVVKSTEKGIRRHKASLGVEFLCRKMPRYITVPDSILANEGYRAKDEKRAA